MKTLNAVEAAAFLKIDHVTLCERARAGWRRLLFLTPGKQPGNIVEI